MLRRFRCVQTFLNTSCIKHCYIYYSFLYIILSLQLGVVRLPFLSLTLERRDLRASSCVPCKTSEFLLCSRRDGGEGLRARLEWLKSLLPLYSLRNNDLSLLSSMPSPPSPLPRLLAEPRDCTSSSQRGILSRRRYPPSLFFPGRGRSSARSRTVSAGGHHLVVVLV